ncbi:MAG: hypothetical protein M3463_13505, partial [Verrucomicrobiota bacterium]|nr:hypothetical protein [Verrucomicrobiota bacterium]
MKQISPITNYRRAPAALCLLALTLLPWPGSAQATEDEIKPTHMMTVPAADVVNLATLPDYEPPAETAGQSRDSRQGDISAETLWDPPLLNVPTPDLYIEGLNQAESGGAGTTLVPPHPHGAVGPTQFVEVVSSRLAVFDKETGERLASISLNALFRTPPPTSSLRLLFSPRVVYDRVHDRWIVIANELRESTTVQRFYVGVSQTGDATGEYFTYTINSIVFPNDFFEFPQLGLDQNAVIVTANISQGRSGGDVLVIPKADLYNGESLRIPRFLNLFLNTVPPIVLDDNPRTFLLTSRPTTPNVVLQALRNT